MTPPLTNDYDRVAYPSMAHPQTYAEALAIKGFLRGLDVAPPERCRVLELGCGDGFNLAAMASSYPKSQYVGIDYSPEAIARGRDFLAELGIGSVHLETADIRELEASGGSLGEFDYIIAHGVYSWVPAEVRDALLAAIGRHLAPHGVAFVSYLALPGAHMREMVRTMIRYHTRNEEEPPAQATQARALLQLVSQGVKDASHFTKCIQSELEIMSQQSDESLFHDQLSEVSAPLLFTEFLAHAGNYGLSYLSESEYLVPISRFLSDVAREKLKPLESNRVQLEQYLDFIEGRRFRQTLLCRAGLGQNLHASRLERLSFFTDAEPLGGSGSHEIEKKVVGLRGYNKSLLRAVQPLEEAVLSELLSRAGNPVPYPQLAAAVTERMRAAGAEVGEGMEKGLRAYLCHVALPGMVEFSLGPRVYSAEVPEKPCVHPLARWMVARGENAVLSYSGRRWEMKGELTQKLLVLADGSRDVEALAAALSALGGPADFESEKGQTLLEQVESTLEWFAKLGLLSK